MFTHSFVRERNAVVSVSLRMMKSMLMLVSVECLDDRYANFLSQIMPVYP